MIAHEVMQSSADWWQLRLGVPTASSFDKIVTSTGKPSAQADGYMDKLLAEWLMGVPIDDYQSAAMERGHDLEPEAWRYYEFDQDVEVVRGGFCTTDDGRLGCSPDGRVYGEEGLAGGIELKCPQAATHVGYMRNPERLAKKYQHQVVGSMLVTGAPWWDLMSYHPLLPPVLMRVTLEEHADYSVFLGAALATFAEELEQAKKRLAAHRRQPTP